MLPVSSLIKVPIPYIWYRPQFRKLLFLLKYDAESSPLIKGKRHLRVSIPRQRDRGAEMPDRFRVEWTDGAECLDRELPSPIKLAQAILKVRLPNFMSASGR
jgi:hypothetical protein